MREWKWKSGRKRIVTNLKSDVSWQWSSSIRISNLLEKWPWLILLVFKSPSWLSKLKIYLYSLIRFLWAGSIFSEASARLCIKGPLITITTWDFNSPFRFGWFRNGVAWRKIRRHHRTIWVRNKEVQTDIMGTSGNLLRNTFLSWVMNHKLWSLALSINLNQTLKLCYLIDNLVQEHTVRTCQIQGQI